MKEDSSEFVALLQLMLAQQRDILNMKAHLMALEEVVVTCSAPEVGRELHREIGDLQHSKVFDGTRAIVARIEQLLAQSLPSADVLN